jgi:hypothetical protein
MTLPNEKVICYLGPSLPLHRAVDLAPNVIYRPPAKQCDILSDTVEIQPDRIILIDGEFLQSLSVWHKELIFAMSKGVKVYGASSMGALRAADLWRQGMIGTGLIYEWYRDGVTEDDSEVALLYQFNPKGVYSSLTIPMVNIRSTISHYAEMLNFSNDHQQALLSAARRIHFTTRTTEKLFKCWEPIIGETITAFAVNNLIDQKAIDAEAILARYALLEPDPASKPPKENGLSKFFWAAYDRDRKITIGSTRVEQQHIEGYIALHAIDHHQILWDAKNFHLAHTLAEKLGVTITEDDVTHEQMRFCARHSITTEEQRSRWLSENNFTLGEFMIMIIRMAAVRRLQDWLSSSLVPIESTKITLDYLKMHNSYNYWAKECADKERLMQEKGVDDNLSVTGKEPVELLLYQHSQKSGITVDGSIDEFVTEAGFATRFELNVALERLKALE